MTILLIFRSSFRYGNFIAATNAAVRGVYDGPFCDPSTHDNTVGTTSYFGLYSLILPCWRHCEEFKVLQHSCSLYIESYTPTISVKCFSGVNGSPFLACGSAAVGIVRDTSRSFTVLLLLVTDEVAGTCAGMAALYSYYDTLAMAVMPTYFFIMF